MVDPQYQNKPILHYIPDPTKREIKAGRIEGLENAVLRALQKSVQPLMTVVAVEDVDIYLSKQHGKEVVLNGQGEALNAYEHEGRRFYRRSDLDALEITISKEIPTPPVQENKEEKNPTEKIKEDEKTIIPAEKEIEEGEQEEEPEARKPIVLKAEPTPPPVYTNAERTERFLPPSRDESKISPAMLLYHALARYGVLEKGNKEGAAKVEEAMQYMSELQRGILELYYVKNGVARRIEERFRITHTVYLRERKAAEDIVKAVIVGTYQPHAEKDDQHTDVEIKKEEAKKSLEDRVKKAPVVDPPFIAAIDAAWQYLSPAQQEVIETIYRKWISNYREVMVATGIRDHNKYYRVKKAAERIIREVASGTYTPPEKKKRDSVGRKLGLKPSERVYDSLLRQRFQGSTIEDKTIAAKVEEALSYLNETQRDVLRYFYEKGMSIPQIAKDREVNSSTISTVKWSALQIIKAVVDGTYNPLAKTKAKEKPPRASETTHQKKERYARRSSDEETEEPDEEEQKPTKKKKPAETRPQRMSEKRKDLLRRLAEHRAAHGKKEDEESIPEMEGERLFYTTKEWKSVAALEDALQKSYAQANQIQKLSGKKLPDDFARITDGDATIDFLVRDECFTIADAYVNEVYTQAVEGIIWPLSDEHIQKQEKENPRDPKTKVKVKEEEVRAGFVAAYDRYKKSQSENALIALFKSTPRLSRGYIATVGWYFASKDEKDEKRKGDWNGNKWKYTPTWKDAWTLFVPDASLGKKKRPKKAVLLSEPQFGHLLEERTEKVLRSRYRQLWYHAETARGSMVPKYTGFAISRAKNFEWTGMHLNDRISLAKEGLLRASQKYDPTSDNNFVTYASHWIQAMITREHRASSNIRITANMWEKIFKIQKEIKDIKKRDLDLDGEELYALVQKRTGIARETIETAMQAVANYNSVVSLDDKAYSEAGSKGRNEKRLSDMIADESAVGIDEEAVQANQEEVLKRARGVLTKRQNYVLDRRFEGDDWEGQTLSEVGKEMGLSRERVRQIEREALIKLREEFNRIPEAKKSADEEEISLPKEITRERPPIINYTTTDVQRLISVLEERDFFRSHDIEGSANVEQVAEALEQISPTTRRILIERYVEKKKPKEITNKRIKHRSVSTMLHQGREKLAKILSEKSAEDGASTENPHPTPFPDMILGASIPNTYTGQQYTSTDPATQAVIQRFTPKSKDIVERYYSNGESLAQIRAETKEPLELIIGILENAGKLLAKNDSTK